MAFPDREESVEAGRPIELYEFGYQGGSFRYTSAAADFEFAARNYVSVAGLSRSAIQEAGELAKSGLVVTAPVDFEVSRLFEVYPPSDVVDLVVTRVHLDDPTDGRTMWLGRVLNVSWTSGYSELRCESLYTRLRSPGLRRNYSRNCPHVLYGAECKASQLAFAQTIVLDSVPLSEFDLSSSEFATFPDGYFSGGKVVFEAGGGIVERRGIRRHQGSLVTLTHPIPGILSTSTVIAYPGCDRTLATCDSRFGNRINFGGFPYMPQKNPFGGNSVF